LTEIEGWIGEKRYIHQLTSIRGDKVTVTSSLQEEVRNKLVGNLNYNLSQLADLAPDEKKKMAKRMGIHNIHPDFGMFDLAPDTVLLEAF
jgi:hypothetical protein